MVKKLLTTLCCSLLVLATGCKDEKPAAPRQAQQASVPTALQDSPELSGENAYVHCAALCALGPRPSNSVAYEKQLVYLSEHLQKAGWRVRRESFTLSNGMLMTNLHAEYGAESAEPRPVLISCHIDTKRGIRNFVGADDGASAAALMLELARVLAAKPEQASKVELLFFDGEEAFASRMSETDGMYGSRYDVMRRKGKLPGWQINLDMVGGRNKMIAVPILDTDARLMQFYTEGIEKLGFSHERWTIYPGSYLDDHQPYVRAGVPSINLIAYFSEGNWWHTSRDDMSRICPHSLADSGRMVLYLLGRLVPEPAAENP
ncbi:MAG: M28 family peptidase [Akkermansia sp.]|nr:M28 family peptidase [Akkermansia sp.]